MSEKIDALRQRHSELLAQIAEARDNGDFLLLSGGIGVWK